MNILVIHPEGNLNYNANLAGILDLLGEAGHRITYAAARRAAINQQYERAHVRMVLVDRQQVKGQFLFASVQASASGLVESDFQPWADHDLVVGVDRGIVEAAWIARHYGVPHALLSYEIFFREETAEDIKAQEIDSCRDVSFAISQDRTRARQLCIENDIPLDRIVQIPVASRGFRAPACKPRRLHEMFQLPEWTKVALHMGSLAPWTGAPFLLDSTKNWPEDWTLVIHHRYGPSEGLREFIRASGNEARVRFSEETFDTTEEMDSFIQSADLGVALYCPTFQNEWVGRNLANIGLSSGKISAYLQQGVPVATHELGEISDWIRHYGAGQIFSLDRPFVPQAPGPDSTQACRRLFEGHLDLDRFGKKLADAVHGLARTNT